jgi:pimeloyl-ACP methyl ester carboxylesterase
MLMSSTCASHIKEATSLLLQGPPVLLIHGYGASAYHWRYQIPALAQHYRVYALDLLGFGWSEKALVEYSSGGLWGQQIGDFIREVIHQDAAASSSSSSSNGADSSSSSSSSDRVVLVGNSLGGYACMNAAVKSPDLIR